MKDFIDKLIGRLKEEKFDCIVAKNYMPEVVELNVVKKIVKELAEQYKPKTNADKIRSMSDEELAELFAKLAWNSEVQTTALKYLDWLQS